MLAARTILGKKRHRALGDKPGLGARSLAVVLRHMDFVSYLEREVSSLLQL